MIRKTILRSLFSNIKPLEVTGTTVDNGVDITSKTGSRYSI
jgi:hypothetical protein